MTTGKQIEALKLALEALELYQNKMSVQMFDDAVKTIREALAEQPAQQQEPVAWMWKDGTVTTDPDRADGTWTPLYTSPQPAHPSKPWVGLTDDEIALICAECSLRTPCDIYYARAIEAKLREKNA